MNLTLLSRILSEHWAMRQENLSLLTQLVLSTNAEPAMAGPGFSPFQKTKLSVPIVSGVKMAGKASRKVQTWDGAVEQFAQAGYQPLNDEAWMAAASEQLPPVPAGVTVIMIWGTVGRGWSAVDKWWMDAVDFDDLTRAIAGTPEGSTVVLWIRSPGGIITGGPETASALRRMGKKRRMLAFSDTLCASAAYWLASQCERIDATVTADIGSIGVYCAFYDWTAYLEKNGIKLELFKAGTMKAMAMPGNPLSDEERAYLQRGVSAARATFVKDVLRNRAIADEYMQGQCLDGAEARAANLVDDNEWESAGEYFGALGKGKV